MLPEKKEKPQSYANVLRGLNHNGNTIMHEDDQQKPPFHNKNNFEKIVPPRRPPTIRYQNMFLGYCFFCRNFGHKAINYRENAINNYLRNRDGYKTSKNDFMSNKNKTSQRFANKNYNSFAPLMNFNVECYKCNNFGHKAHECKSRLEPTKQK